MNKDGERLGFNPKELGMSYRGAAPASDVQSYELCWWKIKTADPQRQRKTLQRAAKKALRNELEVLAITEVDGG